MASMLSYTKAAMERAMKVQEVILRAMAKKITWYQAAEIMGISDRHMRRWRAQRGVRLSPFSGAGGATGQRVYAASQPGSGDLDLIFALQFTHGESGQHGQLPELELAE